MRSGIVETGVIIFIDELAANLDPKGEAALAYGTTGRAVPGYDLATGLGSPNVEALARDFLDIQRGVAPR